MDLGLGGRSALVTGGSRGIGAATAERLAAEGAAVTLVARDAAELENTAARLREHHEVEVSVFAADLRDPDAPGAAVAAAVAAHGRLDVLVNVAGAARGGRLEELDDAAWVDAFGLKFMAAVRATKAALPYLRESGGCVVNVAGLAGWQPAPHLLTVGAVNAALLNVTRALARGVAADGVRVVAVVPGPTDTDRFRELVASRAQSEAIDELEARRRVVAEVPDGRPGRPEEVAAAIAFLVSPQAAHITGVALEVDGGELRGVH